ncbi:MAG TPA: T9SS type A sorting domain-containing protein [Candidatus Kapabacteria bacterium]|nr:T9SS type A sorting domain-containing protein [Candidatus Kapabacteria bacterium]
MTTFSNSHHRVPLSFGLILAITLAIIPSAHAQWVKTNGPTGGIIEAIGAFGSNVFLGTYDDGLFRSTDSGVTWVQVESSLISPNEGAAVFRVSQDSIVFAFDSRNGLLRSLDGGKSWMPIGSGLPKFTLSGNYYPLVGFSVLGSNLLAGCVKGIFRSTDSGTTWVKLSTLIGRSFVILGSALYSASDSGVSVSMDSGATWNTANAGLGGKRPSHLVGSGSTLFAAVGADIFRSEDKGVTWDSVFGGPQNETIEDMVVAGTSVYASASYAGILRSSDSGTTWITANSGLPYTYGYHSVLSLGVSGTKVLAGTSGQGVFVTANFGSTWLPSNTGLTNSIVRALTASGSTLLAGTDAGVSISRDNGMNWSDARIDSGGFLMYCVLAKEPDMFAGTKGLFRSTDSGATWMSAGLTNELVYSVASIGGYLLASTDSGIFRSTDSGMDWTSMNAVLDSNTIGSFVVSGTNVFASATYGIFLSRDSGRSWNFVSLLGPSVTTLIADGTNLFAGTYNKGIYLSKDSGTNWVDSNNGIPLLSTGTSFPSINAFARIDSDIFVGTDSGVFLSTNDGVNWTGVNESLANITIFSLVINNGSLYAGTINNGVWRRPLSEMIPPAAVKDAPSPAQVSAQAYPNPFPTTTTFEFTAPESGFARVWVVNVLGQPIAQLFEGELGAGEHSFAWDATNVPAGTYFCLIQTPASGRQERGRQVVSVRHE